MKTELKDVLHLYLGCLCLIKEIWDDNEKLCDEYIGRLNRIDKIGDKIEVIICDSVVMSLPTIELYEENILNGDVKPILRNLSDMSYIEKVELSKMLYLEEGEVPDERLINQAYVNIRDNFGGPQMSSWRIGFLVIKYLLKQEFDLFELIKTEQAIDKNLLN